MSNKAHLRPGSDLSTKMKQSNRARQSQARFGGRRKATAPTPPRKLPSDKDVIFKDPLTGTPYVARGPLRGRFARWVLRTRKRLLRWIER